MKHPKIKELIHKDFTNFDAIQYEMMNYNACFHCMGVSSAGMTEEQYVKLTYTITENLVNVLYNFNPNMTFIYVSGDGTDSTETSKTMWARVKGKTENLILKKGFKDAYAFRPGIILPKRGVKSKTKLYNLLYTLLRPIFPIMKKMKSVTTSQNIGKAMIGLLENPHHVKIITGSGVNNLVEKNNAFQKC
ncbi:epimerase [Sediminicola sp. 1XM1-17]|uniref:epimerase n=1 Tax=Sediminicola sp. 1XM1-17 TaxID=3127702 RepID=UPI003077735D